MSYVIYNTVTTIIPRFAYGKGISPKLFATESAAKSALTRAVNKGKAVREEYSIADARTFFDTIEKKETVKNLMSGRDVEQSVNTPLCCDPSSETYWSM